MKEDAEHDRIPLNFFNISVPIMPWEATQSEGRKLVTRVILVRHGESTYNLEQRIQGHSDVSTLTPLGRKSAVQVGAALAGLPLSTIYSSPFQRAQETATLIIDQLAQGPTSPPTLQVTEHLKEINLPLWEELRFEDVAAKYPDGYRLWCEAPHKLRMSIPGEADPTGFFPILDLYQRAQQAWEALLPQHPEGTIVLVGHSGIIRALISTALGIGPERYQYLRLTNCSISILNFFGGSVTPVQLESFNLTGHLGQPLPRPRLGHQGCRFLLVRHGETEWNRQKKFQGQIDVPLNTTGLAQAEQVATFLQQVPVDFAVSSPLVRPKATAEAILQHHPAIPFTLNDGLREISHGLWEGKLEAEIELDFPDLLQQWKTSPAMAQMPEGENLQGVWERAIAAWQTVVNTAGPQTTGLVCAHDAVNKAILAGLFGLGPETFWRFKQGNGAVSVVDYPQGPGSHPVLQAMNITSHLGGGVLDRTAAGAL